MDNLIMTTLSKNDLKSLLKESLTEIESEKKALTDSAKTYSIATAAKVLGRSHSTIKKLIKIGKLKTTSDGRRITHIAIQKYLGAEPK